jgi:hypothetical protein
VSVRLPIKWEHSSKDVCSSYGLKTSSSHLLLHSSIYGGNAISRRHSAKIFCRHYGHPHPWRHRCVPRIPPCKTLTPPPSTNNTLRNQCFELQVHASHQCVQIAGTLPAWTREPALFVGVQRLNAQWTSRRILYTEQLY